MLILQIALPIANAGPIVFPKMDSYSQFGEDLLLSKYFQDRNDGFFVEVGANHPTKGSQTYLFEQRGWKGILVEPINENCELLREHRSGSRIFNCALGAPEQRGRGRFNIAKEDGFSGLAVNDTVVVDRVEIVEVRTLDDVLAEAGNPKLDFVSIDVEGTELHVLRGFDLARHLPAVLLVEDWLYSLGVHRHMVRHGYRLVKRTGLNNWYIPRGRPFSMSTWIERLKLLRKMYLGLLFRKRNLARHRRRARQAIGSTG